MKSIPAFFLCLCLIAGLFSGCAQEDTPYVPTGDGLTWEEDYTGPIYTRPQDEQTQDLTLTYYPDRSMNPLLCTDFTNQVLFSLLYQGLFSVDRNYNVEPQLCKNYRSSRDMRTHSFYLMDATFSDGTPVTPQDVAASLTAAMTSTRYGGRFFHISTITVADDGAVVIQTDTAYEDLAILLDIPIIKQTELEADRPIGSGPYRLSASLRGLQLVKNTNWWCSADLAVDADAIALIEAESTNQIRDSFQFDDLGLVCADPGSDRYADYRCDYELWDAENGIFLFIGCSMVSDVFTNEEFRAALTYAIDRDMLTETFYRGFARSATLPASPQSPYYNSNLASRYGYDKEKFAQAVKDAGMEGTEVIFMVNSDDSLRVRVARAIADSLREGGLVVTMKEVPSSEYLESLRMRYYDLYLGQTSLSPNMDLSAFFHENGALSYGSVNDVAAYALCLQALENHGNYYTLHKTVMDQGLLCPVLFRSYAVYATRGLITKLTPARNNIFYYSLGRSMEKALLPN